MSLKLYTTDTRTWGGNQPSKPVKFQKLELREFDLKPTWGELCLHFDESKTIEELECLFGDQKILEGLRKHFKVVGLSPSGISYSESGMQKCTYLSFDVGAEFIRSWRACYGDRDFTEL
jgi:hypothetical protein